MSLTELLGFTNNATPSYAIVVPCTESFSLPFKSLFSFVRNTRLLRVCGNNVDPAVPAEPVLLPG